MGCGASVPQNGGGAPVTRVMPAPAQPVSEAQSAISFQPSRSNRSSLEKINSLTDRASPEQVLQNLLDGNMRFLDGAVAHPHQDFSRVQAIKAKQKPLAAILGCADSRVPAEIVFDQGFGDVFVCRVAGNIATPEEIASLEYAVLDLGVKVVMVLGHTRCGAVKAALSGKAFPGFIDTLVDHLDVAISRVNSMSAKAHQAIKDGDVDMLDRVVKENVKYQVQRCQRSVIIQEGLQKGNLLLAGAVYDLDTGKVHVSVTKGGSSAE
ncbi:hypothetical protein CHLRE_12g485050v5 [Chlamydomonas reinhardtii]|uniref:Carbonic anhydrase n=1 Tax=Chlamydomonas reinhardtii TaxID=3055 RepID=Q6S7R9_CHLRE|nr:uncharacterized protein CHLRE_12g485050v5 [Chlamydomonas reinhardtii]AAR82947.1 chloroplast beta carbonic anhydrase [Chlamydomonas reinhardtii]AAR82948.1 chloroplast beta carbonic anhydrase [Chlamydomonas reinhardtii]PNW74462.1 hypothetical protein CHLRE_12g485050v5 [Chlamydomonas reinhardtii]|eukprot:XP_001703176.1 carbonic anhydrase 6 [Chlamydomonas reinhardtii]